MRDRVRGWMGMVLALSAALPAGAATPAVIAGFQYGYVQIEFDQPMQTWPNERRDDVVALQPRLPVQCSWDSDTRLRCQFTRGARPALATRYRVQIAAGLKTQAGDVLPARTVDIETARPQLSASIEGWQNGAPRIVVSSEAKITGRAMAAVLRLRIDNRAVALPPLRMLPTRGRWDDGSRFGLQLPAIEGRDRRLVLAVVPGLESSAGPLPGMQNDVLLTAQINERFALRGIACAGRNETIRALPANGKVEATCQPRGGPGNLNTAISG